MAGNPVRSLNVKVLADIKDFQTKMSAVTKQAQKIGSNLQSMGKTLSLSVTAPLAAMGALAVKSFGDQAKAEAQLSAAIRATGGDAEKSLANFKEFASGLQQVTTVGDEATLQLLQVSKSMGLSDEQSKSAAKNAIALSKSMGINVQSAIRYTAALEQGDSTMLNRYIPTLKKIKDPTERAAKAQELLGQMFSAAEAEAQSGLGPLIQLKNSLGDLMEEFGGIIATGITPFIEKLKGMVASFQAMSPHTKEMIVRFAAIAASIGPVLLILGKLVSLVPVLVNGFGILKAALLALTGPFGLIIAAVAGAVALIIANWDEIVAYFTEGEGATAFTFLKGIVIFAMEGIRDAVNWLIGVTTALWSEYGENVMELFNIWTNSILGMVQTAFKFLGDIIKGGLAHVMGIWEFFAGLFTGDWSRMWEGLKGIVAGIVNPILNLITNMSNGILGTIADLASALGMDDVSDSLNSVKKDVSDFVQGLKVESKIAEEAAGKVDSFVDSIMALGDAKKVVNKIPIEKDGADISTDPNLSDFGGGGEDTTEKDKQKRQKAFNEARKKEEIALTEDLQQIELDRANGLIKSDEEAEAQRLQKQIESKENAISLARFFNQETLDMERELDEMLHQQQLTAIEQEKATDEAKQEAKRAAVQSGVDGAQNLIGALQNAGAQSKALALADIAINTARGISGAIAVGAQAGPFPGNLGAIATGVAAVVTGIAQAKAALSQAPALAQGGLAFGPTMAMVGDNIGAATDPEVIAPLSKLMPMMGGGGFPDEVILRASGNSLEATMRRQNQRNRRNN